MGVCTSTNPNGHMINTIYQSKNQEQVQDSFEPPCWEEEQIGGESPNSEICLLDTDELHQNSEKATQEQCQREFVNRIVSVHDSPNSKRYYFVYDKLYNVKRKVPKLKSINQSTLIQKRRQLIL
ncbi:unnamed protein product (macronuclear) [Paramecium tetraurelia]|uniref:Uncharacterized protein n=1 Tax=Paramecium tetraurelia TaxID=5888 RepID=A0DBH0_PARTE|nr:uncharacterized protein GSPATT00015282001 [Paramecium tetraurelia]CAK80387.1 unnamed protein product [Paramecium tetraurelia]|eukprot:XP_001447784.1 hypothetical protein (macronuclear) [Paramecium tetraurelia strain d4-2]